MDMAVIDRCFSLKVYRYFVKAKYAVLKVQYKEFEFAFPVFLPQSGARHAQHRADERDRRRTDAGADVRPVDHAPYRDGPPV